MKHLIRLAAISMCLTAMFASSAHAVHAWANYHWARTANPFTVKLGDNASAAWDPYLANAAADWQLTSGSCNNASNPVRCTIVAGSSGSRKCNAVSGTVQVCNNTYGSNGWLGLASISINGDHITAGTVKMNDTYYNTATYNTPAWRRLVMEQEVGHCFGLGHQDENQTNADLLDACGRGSCMDYSNNPANQGTPNQHDYDQLVTIYSHLDATTTLAAKTAPGLAFANPAGDFDLDMVDPENQGTWGAPVEFHNGRPVVFERQMGPNKRVVTHVFWVE